jgi:hypothetical protein
MSSDFEIEIVNWLERKHGDALVRASLAEIRVRIGTRIATAVQDLTSPKFRDIIRVSAHRLALWFAGNWWRLRWEPANQAPEWKMSHCLAAAGGGYAWPDLSFVSDGKTMTVHCRPTAQAGADPVQFLSDFDVNISTAAFESGIDAFIDAVLQHLPAMATDQSELKDLWQEVREERGDRDTMQWRKLEAMLGFDPDEGPAELIAELQRRKTDVGSEAVEELAVVARDRAIELLESLRGAAQTKAMPAQIPEYGKLRQETPAIANPHDPPWKQGVLAARAARETWGLPPGPVSDERILDLFSAPSNLLKETSVALSLPVSAGYRVNGDGRLSVFLNKRHPTGLRFALSRLVADHLYAPGEDRILPATDAKTARQKFQRSFAQEFLCPFDDLRAYIDDRPLSDEIIEEAADYFQVSPLLTKTTLVNRGLLVRDALEL